MSNAPPITTRTIFAEATITEDGSLRLDDPGLLAFKPGDKVALTISPLPHVNGENAKLLRGTVTHYEEPFGPAAPAEEWEALR